MLHALTTAGFVFAGTFALAAIVGTIREHWPRILQLLEEVE